MSDHSLLQAIARVNRLYENDQAEMVKPHGFVLDFDGACQVAAADALMRAVLLRRYA